MTTDAVADLLDAITAGTGVPERIYAEDAVLDGTVPNWRFRAHGPEAIARALGRWFAHPAALEDLQRRRTPDGEVVSYLATWEEDGAPFAAHHCHVITLGPERTIVRDTVWCGGRWGAKLLAEMGALADA
jgi:hypothetical protein